MDPIAVEDESVEHGIFDYEVVFPSISFDAMRQEITDDDILVANPSFSNHGFGLNCRGRKIMYVQGFNTFRLLDCRFDLYVSVSRFVQRFLSGTYGIEAEVIPPFIRGPDNFPAAPAWQDRPPGSILVSAKAGAEGSLAHLRRLLPEASLCNVLGRKVPWRELMARFGKNQVFLTLSPAEGFGLMPLEAMAMGCAVVGFDGFGGRDYMCSGLNCAVTSYADIEGVADRLAAVLSDSDYAEILTRAGRATAQAPLYTYQRFHEDWRRTFQIKHAELIVKAADANTHLFVVAGCGHDVSLKLKEQGILSRLVEAAINGTRDEASVQLLLSACWIACCSAPDSG